MKLSLVLAGLTTVSATRFLGGTATAISDNNPPPYEVYNIAIENSAANARNFAEESAEVTSALNSIAETRSRADKVLEGLTSIDAMHKQQYSFLKSGGASDFSVVEVSLASPQNPHPAVAAKIASLEAARESMEASKLTALTASYASILSGAKAEISRALGGKKSFLKLNPIEPSIDFNLVSSASDDSSAGAALDKMEASRQAAEAQMMDSAIAELGEFAKVYVAETQKGIRASFLRAVPSTAEGFHRQLNVKFLPNPSYASVANMASSMERRRDISEAAVRAAILDMEVSLAKSLNAFAAGTLRA